VIEKTNAAKKVKIPNPKGGSLEIKFTDDSELAAIILSCIADNELYVVRDPRIIQLVFGLVKEKVKNKSLVMTPNMLRLLALKLLNNDQSLIAKFGNIAVSSENRIRLVTRVLGSAVLAFVGGLFSMFPYALLMAVFYFDSTENCGYKCQNYFELISKEQPTIIYAEKSTGNLVIGENDAARQVVIYTRSNVPAEIVLSNTKEATIKKNYRTSRKQAKEVKFSDFKKTDLMLSAFDDLEEPYVPEKLCLINDIHNVVGIE
jgi:hypothetical protein